MHGFNIRLTRNSTAAARRRMVRDQLEARGIGDARVLEAMESTPREEFVEPQYRDSAYNDGPLPIGHGQTISQPFTVAFMLEALRLQPQDRVLEVGGGCGYAAAVLAGIVSEVHTIERLKSLADEARERLKRLGLTNVHVHHADGTEGLADQAPFDAIVVAAGGKKAPQPLLDQLVDGGRLVIPLGDAPTSQTMRRFTRRDKYFEEENLGAFAFVPLVGKHGW